MLYFAEKVKVKTVTWYFIRFISIWPYPFHYFLSIIFKFLAKNIFQYRKRVVLENLTRAFPDKNQKELNKIASGFYAHYSLVMLETLKIPSMTRKELEKRIQIATPESFEQFKNEPRGAVILTGHLGNFEWAGQWMGYQLNKPLIAAYRPFSSESWEFVMQKIRSAHQTRFIPAKNLLKQILPLLKDGLYLTFLNDQLPAYSNDHFWIPFFKEETMFFAAPAKLAVKFQLPVYFIDMWRTRPGYYSMSFEKLELELSNRQAEDILKAYVNWLENAIRKHPYAWLWSHKRWKRSRLDQPEKKE